MKKALVVLLVLTCLAAAAFADTTLKASGEVTYGLITNGTAANTTDGWPNGYVNFTASADANNSAVLGFSWWNNPQFKNPVDAGGTPSLVATYGGLPLPNVELAYVKSDIGGALSLGDTVDPVLYAGFGVFDLPGYQITQYGSERIAAMGIDNGTADGEFGAEAGPGYSLAAVDVGVMKMVHIVAAAAGNVGQSGGGQALIGAYGGVGPISAEIGWDMKNSVSGYVPIGVQFASSFGDIALTAMANIQYNANSGAVTSVLWSAGAKVAYQGNYTVDAAVIEYVTALTAANPNTAQYKLTGDVMANFTPTLGIVISPYLNFNSGADLFDTLEAFVWTSFGATKLRIGYLYMAGAANDLNAGPDYATAGNGNKGGVWFTVDYNF